MSFRVLITRDPNRAKDLSDLLNSRGIEAIIQPVTQTVYTWQNQPIPNLADFTWIAFTSAHAVIGFSQALQASGRKLPDTMPLAVVGQATGAESSKRLRPPDLVAEASSSGAQGLAQALAGRKLTNHGETILWPCSALAGDDFMESLAVQGVKVTPWECYTTQPIPVKALRECLKLQQPWHSAVFAAPSAVRAFADAWSQPWDFACVAFGQTTAYALVEIGVKEPFVSSGPDAAHVAQRVIESLARMNQQISGCGEESWPH